MIAGMDTTEQVKIWVREQAAKGGRARARRLSPERRSEIARSAGLAPKKTRRKKDAADTR